MSCDTQKQNISTEREKIKRTSDIKNSVDNCFMNF
jgi:hypothetical protein